MLLDYLNVSLLMMLSKPVRSILSLLGIYIGVLALVVILAIREGVRGQLEGLYKTNGAHVIFIHPGFDRVAKKIGRLTQEDVWRLSQVPGVLSAMARASAEKDIRTPAATLHAHLTGIDDRFISLYRVPLIRGRNFLKEEIDKRQAVCLLTVETTEKLFPTAEPIGQTIDLEGTAFRIIGVVDWDTETAGRTSLSEVDVLIPALWLAPKEGEFISMVEVRVRPEMSIEQGVQAVKTAISHGVESRENLYFVRSLEEMVERSRAFNDRILGGLLGIAGISLLVGGIGVANVMITSVTERTREVGIRKALGATRVHILSQFLVEASMLSASGGLLAVATGVVGVSVVKTLFNVSIPLAIPVLPCAACLFLTIVIGLVAGVYPASRAASLSPAEALRYE